MNVDSPEEHAQRLARIENKLNRLEVKIDAIGLMFFGARYARDWDNANFHQSMGMK